MASPVPSQFSTGWATPAVTETKESAQLCRLARRVMGLALNLEELLGGVRAGAREPPQIEAGAVHSNGLVDLARLIPRGAMPVRPRTPRSILTAPKSRPIS